MRAGEAPTDVPSRAHVERCVATAAEGTLGGLLAAAVRQRAGERLLNRAPSNQSAYSTRPLDALGPPVDDHAVPSLAVRSAHPVMARWREPPDGGWSRSRGGPDDSWKENGREPVGVARLDEDGGTFEWADDIVDWLPLLREVPRHHVAPISAWNQDVLELVAQHLDPGTLIQLRRVSKRFRDGFNDYATWATNRIRAELVSKIRRRRELKRVSDSGALRKELVASIDRLRRELLVALQSDQYLAVAARDPELFDLLYRVVIPGKLASRLYSAEEQIAYLQIRLAQIWWDPAGAFPQGIDAPELVALSAKRRQRAAFRIANRLAAEPGSPRKRLPYYYHRTKPATISLILSSGRVIVTDSSAAGRGAYVSTNADAVYGPVGVAFDMRALHTMDLSVSTDNNKRFTGETSGRGSFRAMASPISLRHAVYVMWDEGARSDLGALRSTSPVPLVRMVDMQLERVLIEELVGRIEPRHWTRRWHKGALFIDKVVSMAQSAKEETADTRQGAADSEWEDDGYKSD
jgi:hypothetical protein